ncbi:hypothetical protein Hanom_Chr10g00888781 [Helianthus anomalus]
MMIILTCFWNTVWSIIAPPPGLLFTVLSSTTTPPLPKPQRLRRIPEYRTTKNTHQLPETIKMKC